MPQACESLRNIMNEVRAEQREKWLIRRHYRPTGGKLHSSQQEVHMWWPHSIPSVSCSHVVSNRVYYRAFTILSHECRQIVKCHDFWVTHREKKRGGGLTCCCILLLTVFRALVPGAPYCLHEALEQSSASAHFLAPGTAYKCYWCSIGFT